MLSTVNMRVHTAKRSCRTFHSSRVSLHPGTAISVATPVDPQYLAHLFNDPSCINENYTWILDQLPRRIIGELHGKAGQPAEGWGIYYQEAWNWRFIALIMVAVFGLVSLFGILWAYYKQDIQGTFRVSSYVFAACGIFLSLITINSNRA